MRVRQALTVALLVSHLTAPIVVCAQADTATTSFDVNGLKVILRRNAANDVVAANVYLLGGAQQLTPAIQGIESFLLQVSERGTKNFPREAVRQRTTRIGSTIAISPSDDWTVFGFTTTRAAFDSTWLILADRLMAPTLDSNEVELVRARMLVG